MLAAADTVAGLHLLDRKAGEEPTDVPAEQATFVEAGSGIVAALLQLVSIWGRIRATARIESIAAK